MVCLVVVLTPALHCAAIVIVVGELGRSGVSAEDAGCVEWQFSLRAWALVPTPVGLSQARRRLRDRLLRYPREPGRRSQGRCRCGDRPFRLAPCDCAVASGIQ